MKKLILILFSSILILAGCNSTPDNPYAKNTEIESEDCNHEADDDELQPNVKVDIGYDSDFATRNYYAYTNEYGQLVYIYAEEIILLDESETERIEDADKPPTTYCDYEVDNIYTSGKSNQTESYERLVPDDFGAKSNEYNTIVASDHGASDAHTGLGDLERLIEMGSTVTNFEVKIIYPNGGSSEAETVEYTFEIDGEFHTASYNI